MNTQQSGTSVSCPYEMWDGSYVLGSLSPAERREFEAHLDGCRQCSRAVRDLAGLPGLLSRIGPEVFEQSEPEPVPETLLPRLSRAVRRQQQRRTWLTAGIAAAAAVVVTTAGAVVLGQANSSSNEAGNPSTSVATTAPPQGRFRTIPTVSNDPMIASVALTPVAWGTRLDLNCSYPRNAAQYESGSYVMVVHTRDGQTERVASWNGVPGETMHVSGATSTWKKDITSVAVTHSDGTPIAVLNL
jgi:anti-sigma-K factor RskA